jgi:RimJ/RimL family protein N-acetyltransferase
MMETERLTLHEPSAGDRAPFVAMCADPEVMQDYGGAWDSAYANERFDR